MSHGYDTFEKKRKWLVCGQLCFDVSFSGVVLLLDNQNRICFFVENAPVFVSVMWIRWRSDLYPNDHGCRIDPNSSGITKS